MLVFNAAAWLRAGGDVGDNSQFFEVCEIISTYCDVRESSNCRGEVLAIVQWPDGSITRGHIASAMEKVGTCKHCGYEIHTRDSKWTHTATHKRQCFCCGKFARPEMEINDATK